ncbi:MAG: murein L,D-transpeptidase YcbB/YkuD [Myxococcota bacterium]|jgi:murein L,D-transpeptidase YcbB/YkuD
MNRLGRAVWPLVVLTACAGSDRVEVSPSLLGDLPDPEATAPPAYPATAGDKQTPFNDANSPESIGFAPRPQPERVVAYRIDSLDSIVARVKPESMGMAVHKFYTDSGGAWLWSDGLRLSPAGRRVLALIQDAKSHGLRPGLLNLQELLRLESAVNWAEEALERTPKGAAGRPSVEQLSSVVLAELDAPLTAAAMMLSRQLFATRAGGEALAQTLPSRAELDAWVDDLLPWHPQYTRLLRYATPRYRALRRAEWPTITLPDEIKHMGRGGRGPQIVTLRKRLATEGFLTGPDQTSSRFDAPLRDDLRRFQYTRGIKRHGLLDSETVAALNEQPARLFREIQRAMSEWRRSDTRQERTYVQVNLPEYQVEFYRGRERVLTSTAVIGYAFKGGGGRTPRFHRQIEQVVLNPGWTPSDEVMNNTLLRKEAAQPGYLRRNGFEEIQRPDGRKGLYQLPGARNALGRVKLTFPNDNNIYLHGSPDRGAFEADMRALSRGCVRVQDMEALAWEILSTGDDMGRVAFDFGLNAGREQKVELSQPIPIHFEYRRVVVDDDQTVRFLRNVYQL